MALFTQQFEMMLIVQCLDNVDHLVEPSNPREQPHHLAVQLQPCERFRAQTGKVKNTCNTLHLTRYCEAVMSIDEQFYFTR